MPSAFRNPKNLSEWLELDYFRRRRPLARWKPILTWITLAVFLLGSAAAYFVPRSSRMLQAGPVSSAHGFFNNDCGQCHTEPFQTAKRLFRWDGSVRAVSNEACTRCHDGPPHNSHQTVELDCSACHREHRGRATLARVPDADCTQCHADLKSNHAIPEKCDFENVTSFPDGHLEFGLWRGNDSLVPEGRDLGQLRFNHAVHLKSDGVLLPDGAKKVLECRDCHQSDVAGRYMQPLNYDRHCRVCHPLSVRLTGNFASPELQNVADAFAKEPAPHKEPRIIRAILRDRLLSFAAAHRIVGGETDDLDLIYPKSRRMQPALDRVWTTAGQRINDSESALFANAQLPDNEQGLFQRASGCVYCHIEKPKDSEGGPEADAFPTFARTNLRERWLPHSRFRHEAHRMLTCTECHDARNSKETSDVLMPKIESCARCHSAIAGARHDCVECHQYHRRPPGSQMDKGKTIEESLGNTGR